MDIYHRIATSLGWSYPVIDQLTLPEVEDLFDYWADHPPTHELVAMQIGYARPLTAEEKIEQGAMGPGDFLQHFKKTRGVVNPKVN